MPKKKNREEEPSVADTEISLAEAQEDAVEEISIDELVTETEAGTPADEPAAEAAPATVRGYYTGPHAGIVIVDVGYFERSDEAKPRWYDIPEALVERLEAKGFKFER